MGSGVGALEGFCQALAEYPRRVRAVARMDRLTIGPQVDNLPHRRVVGGPNKTLEQISDRASPRVATRHAQVRAPQRRLGFRGRFLRLLSCRGYA
jgi:hypothetical protein